jgi:hypothetical protein
MVAVVARRVVLEIEKGPRLGREFQFVTALRFLVGCAREVQLRLPVRPNPAVEAGGGVSNWADSDQRQADLQERTGAFSTSRGHEASCRGGTPHQTRFAGATLCPGEQ